MVALVNVEEDQRKVRSRVLSVKAETEGRQVTGAKRDRLRSSHMTNQERNEAGRDVDTLTIQSFFFSFLFFFLCFYNLLHLCYTYSRLKPSIKHV